MSKPKGKKSGADKSLILRNKKAFHEYEILETLECGIELCGTEVKSLRARAVSFAQTFASVRNGELMLNGLHISTYEMGNRMNHIPERRRRLLAHKREIHKLAQKVNERGFTLVPLRLYWKFGRCKVEIGIARGKQLHDKRDAKRDKDVKRQIDREMRESHR